MPRPRRSSLSALRRLAAAATALVVAAILATGLVGEAPSGQMKRIEGAAKISDGDTIRIRDERIRLLEIDAPERDQVCRGASGADYPCGARATEALRKLVGGAPVVCVYEERDRYGRPLARCSARGRDLGEAMIASGMAVVYRDRPELYGEAEARAKARGLGMWEGDFVAPWDFRAGKTLAPLTGRQLDEALDARKSGCAIKGNISGSGRIYHMPGQADYERARIDAAKGERWFCTEAEAVAAGWRPARR